MNIKDYLHLYLGCEVIITEHWSCAGAFTYKAGEVLKLTPGLLELMHNTHNSVQASPLLRPLSDMTEEELREAMTICYRSVYSSEPSFDSIEMVEDESGGGLKATEHPEWAYGLTITLDGPMFSANGRFLNIPVFDVTRYLLSRGFDLFGLIDAGLALDKTKCDTLTDKQAV